MDDSGSSNSPPRSRSWSPVAVTGFLAAVGCGAAAALAALGYRWEWWSLQTGFSLLRWAAYAALAVCAVSVIGLIHARPGTGRRGIVWAAAGLAMALVVARVPWGWQQAARAVPPIHDISTDLEHPPEFMDVIALRADSPNSADYGGEEIAALQRQAYPDIAPAVLAITPDEAFDRALAVVRRLDWTLVAAVKPEGRIEATDTTFWFGFRDDVVIRVTAIAGGSRVDIRSVSRVGRSDAGTNAARIRTFLKQLTAEVQGEA